jgi:hypothetical protein
LINKRTVKNILQTGRNITPNITSFTLAMPVATLYQYILTKNPWYVLQRSIARGSLIFENISRIITEELPLEFTPRFVQRFYYVPFFSSVELFALRSERRAKRRRVRRPRPRRWIGTCDTNSTPSPVRGAHYFWKLTVPKKKKQNARLAHISYVPDCLVLTVFCKI